MQDNSNNKPFSDIFVDYFKKVSIELKSKFIVNYSE